MFRVKVQGHQQVAAFLVGLVATIMVTSPIGDLLTEAMDLQSPRGRSNAAIGGWRRTAAIGDAAHVMSPIGCVGINYAIQDAVAAANLLAEPLLGGALADAHLAAVQPGRSGCIRPERVRPAAR